MVTIGGTTSENKPNVNHAMPPPRAPAKKKTPARRYDKMAHNPPSIPRIEPTIALLGLLSLDNQALSSNLGFTGLER